MPGKNKPNKNRPRPDTDVSRIDRAKNRQTNISGPNAGEVNRGNTIHTGSELQTVNKTQSDELHTKRSVTGSDTDGQAE